MAAEESRRLARQGVNPVRFLQLTQLPIQSVVLTKSSSRTRLSQRTVLPGSSTLLFSHMSLGRSSGLHLDDHLLTTLFTLQTL